MNQILKAVGIPRDSAAVENALAEQMSSEDGCVSVIDSFDDNAESVTAFTRRALDYLEELLDDRRSEFMKDA